jgi:NTP pyrophosphatase (non-canonical NTP hydrolase)
MHISELQDLVKELLVEKGFGYGKDTFWEKLALTHTEVSELADVVKKQGFDAQADIEGEVADIIIRAVNFAVMFDFDLESAISEKMSNNFNRPYKYNTHEQLSLELQLEKYAEELVGQDDRA